VNAFLIECGQQEVHIHLQCIHIPHSPTRLQSSDGSAVSLWREATRSRNTLRDARRPFVSGRAVRILTEPDCGHSCPRGSPDDVLTISETVRPRAGSRPGGQPGAGHPPRHATPRHITPHHARPFQSRAHGRLRQPGAKTTAPPASGSAAMERGHKGRTSPPAVAS